MIININSKNFKVQNNYKFWKIFVNKKWEPINFKIYKNLINNHTNYYDVGAWIGPTFFIAAGFSPKNIYCFEPDQKAFFELKKNILLNKKKLKKINIKIYNKAAYIANCSKKLYIPYLGKGQSISSLIRIEGKKFITQNTKCIDFLIFLNSQNLNSKDLIKIDIEGGEYDLLPHLEKVIQKTRPNIYLSLHSSLIKGLFNKIFNNYRLLISLRGYRYIYMVKKRHLLESVLLKNLIYLRIPFIKNIKDSLIFSNKRIV